MILSAIFVLAAAHPFTTYPWSLARFPRRDRGVVQATDWPPPHGHSTISICMSVYNEERVIDSKARSLIAMADAYAEFGETPVEILVYVDGQTDRTSEILEAYRHRIKIVSSLERRGKTHGLKTLVSMSRGELIVFTDANVVAPVDSLAKLAEELRDPRVGCAGARLVYNNAAESDTSSSGAEYWNLEESIKSLESETVGVIGLDGALFMVRRDVYEPPPDDIIDDLFVSLIALIKGYHIVSVQGVVVQERGATSAQEEFLRKARISCQAMNVHRLLWPHLRRLPAGAFYAYVSHRLLKWLTPYLLLAGAACGAIGMVSMMGLYQCALLFFSGALVIGLCAAVRVKLVLRAGVYLLMLTGVAVGVFQSLFMGRRYVTWSPAVSVRAV